MRAWGQGGAQGLFGGKAEGLGGRGRARAWGGGGPAVVGRGVMAGGGHEVYGQWGGRNCKLSTST